MATAGRRLPTGRRCNFAAEDCNPLRAARRSAATPRRSDDVPKLLRYIEDNVVGRHNTFCGPFGRRKVIFCDYASSGRSLHFIEDYIQKEVLPCYGNTNNSSSFTSLQSSLFRQEAKDIIKAAANGNEDDTVIFTGPEPGAAIRRLLQSLDLTDPPIVFLEPCDHLSTQQPWIDAGAKIIRIAESKDGFLDLNDLEEQLRSHQFSGRQLIGCFSAASNISGLLADDVASTLLLNEYGALAVWDCTITAPNAALDMNPSVSGLSVAKAARKDAIFFSGHKFAGGVQTPGILVVKKSLLKGDNEDALDGNVFFSQEDYAKYSQDIRNYEENNSATLIEEIRAGLVVQLKETVGVEAIMQRQEKIARQMLAFTRTIQEVVIVGNASASLKRLPVLSFMVRHSRGTFLHHNFVVAVLNDVFGIQARGGCACVGPYAQDLLGINDKLAAQFEEIMFEDVRSERSKICEESRGHYELLRPGFARISLPYFMSDSEVLFVLEALKMVATEAWKILPQYTVDPRTGEWKHYSNIMFKDRKQLGSIRYSDGKMSVNERRVSGPGIFPQNHAECLQTARNIFNRARKSAQRTPVLDPVVKLSNEADTIRWFMLPSEAQDLLLGNSQNVKHNVPFDPIAYTGSRRNRSSGGDSPVLRHMNHEDVFQYQVAPELAMAFPQCRSPIQFAVGGEVMPQRSSPRERCFSLGATSIPSPTAMSPRNGRLSLGPHLRHNCNCSSQTDLQSMDYEANQQHLQAAGEPASMGRCSPSVAQGNFEAYVQEVTKEIATEIASEIREVISKMEDALEGADSIDPANYPAIYSNQSSHDRQAGSGSDDGRSDSISANDVAEYLVEVSKEMANEVKSEIREVVSAVDVFITPDERHSLCCEKPAPGTMPKMKKTSRSSLDTLINGIKKSNSVTRLTDEDGALPKKMAINSVSSQDSGINLDHDLGAAAKETGKKRSNSESSGCRVMKKSCAIKHATLQRRSHCDACDADNDACSDRLSFQIDSIDEGIGIRWFLPPDVVWKSAKEAIAEFGMIRNGDKILVCLSGGKDSLCLLHTLHHLQHQADKKGPRFSLGAANVNDNFDLTEEFRSFATYVQELGVEYLTADLCEEQMDLHQEKELNQFSSLNSFSDKRKRAALYALAKSHGYNVLAVGQHLDDLSESFLMSVFHTGKLKTMKAHYNVKDQDLRVIRPFVYVREKLLKYYASTTNLPLVLDCQTCVETPKERFRTKQLLAQQEILFPRLFSSLKLALHPLMYFTLMGRNESASIKGDNASENSFSISDSDTDEEPASISANFSYSCNLKD